MSERSERTDAVTEVITRALLRFVTVPGLSRPGALITLSRTAEPHIFTLTYE